MLSKECVECVQAKQCLGETIDAQAKQCLGETMVGSQNFMTQALFRLSTVSPGKVQSLNCTVQFFPTNDIITTVFNTLQNQGTLWRRKRKICLSHDLGLYAMCSQCSLCHSRFVTECSKVYMPVSFAGIYAFYFPLIPKYVNYL